MTPDDCEASGMYFVQEFTKYFGGTPDFIFKAYPELRQAILAEAECVFADVLRQRRESPK